jgi:hypothetical protein
MIAHGACDRGILAMNVTLIVAQVLHVLSGVFWAGTTFALARLGGNHDQLFKPQMGAAVVAVATGAWLWFLLHGGSPGTQEHILGLGAIFAIAAAGVQGMLRRRRPATGQRIAAALLAVTVICMAAARYV